MQMRSGASPAVAADRYALSRLDGLAWIDFDAG